MNPLTRVVHFFDEEEDNNKQYNALFNASKLLISQSTSLETFFTDIETYISDLIVINEITTKVDSKKIIKKLQSDKLTANILILLLVEKMVFFNADLAKKLKVKAIEIYPFENNIFLQAVKKTSRDSVIEDTELEDKMDFPAVMNSVILQINETGFKFKSPVRLGEGMKVKIESELIDWFGIDDNTREGKFLTV